MTETMIDIPVQGGSYQGFLALPEGNAPAPGVIVLQEIFGVNDVMKGICRDLAAKGYAALCPDLFWRLEPGITLTDKTDEEWQQAFDYMNRFNQDQGIRDIQAAIDRLRDHPASTGKVGAMGYCLGGRLAFMTATRTDADCAIGYYGVGLDGLTGEARGLATPLMLHIATEDEYCPPEAQGAIHAALDDEANVILHDYIGQDHAFARRGGAHYDADAAELANARSADFLKANIG